MKISRIFGAILASVLLLSILSPRAEADGQKTASQAVEEMVWGVNLADLYIADVDRGQGDPVGCYDRADFGLGLWFWNGRFEWLAGDGPQPDRLTVSADYPRYTGGSGQGPFELAMTAATFGQQVRLTLSDSRILLADGTEEALPALDGTYDLRAAVGPDIHGRYTALLDYDRSALPQPGPRYNGARLEITVEVEEAPFVSPEARAEYFYEYHREPMDREAYTDLFLDQGANVIRLPVTWSPFLDDETFEIDRAWLDAVAREVRYILDRGAYCILDMHYDYFRRSYVGDHWESNWMDERYSSYVDARFRAAWEQIALYFRDYPAGLILEACNAPTMSRTPESTPDFQELQLRRVNELNRIFYETVRETGGGNRTRLLCLAVGDYNQARQLERLELPAQDPYLLAQVHVGNAMEAGAGQPDSRNAQAVDGIFAAIARFTEETGVPVIIGETGVTHGLSEEQLAPQVEYFFRRAREAGVPCLWWEDSREAAVTSRFWLYDKKEGRWGRPLLLQAIRKGAGVAEQPSLEGAQVTVEGSFRYNGQPQIPQVQVTLADGEILPPELYTVTCENNVLATAPDAPAIVRVKAEGYAGTARGSFSIAPADLTVRALDQTVDQGREVREGPQYVAAEAAQGDALTYVRLRTDGEDNIIPYEARIEKNGLDVTHCYRLSFESGKRTWRVDPISLEGAWIEVFGSCVYNGQPQLPPELQVNLPNGWVLPEGQYTVTAENNIFATTEDSPAILTVTANPDGAYTGSVQGTFAIEPRPLTVQAGDQEITWGEDIAMGPDRVKAEPAEGDVVMGVRLTAAPDKTIEPSEVLIQRGDTDVTSSYAVTYLPGTLTERKAQPKLEFVDYHPARAYNGRPLALPTAEQIQGADYDSLTFTWYRHTPAHANQMEGAPVDAGTYFLKVRAEETDTSLPAQLTSEAIRISPRRIDVAALSWTQTKLTFNNREQTVTLTDLPGYITAGEYTGNTGLYAGLYTATVQLTCDRNHSLSAPHVSITWRIVPAPQTVTVLHGVDNPYVMAVGEKVDLSELVRPGVGENPPIFTLEEDSPGTLEGSVLTATGEGSINLKVRVGAWDCNGDGAMEYADADARSLWITVTAPAPTAPAPTEPEPTEPAPTDPAPTEPAVDSAPSFTDVSPDAWYADAVDYVLEEKLMTGVEETRFGVSEQTSRAMLAAILYRMAGSPEVTGESPFGDVTGDRWYSDAVIWAAENTFMAGVTPDCFAPDESVPRVQLATVLYRFAQLRGYDTSARASLSAYTDADEIRPWALEPMQWAVAEGLLGGTGSGALEPLGDAVRSQTAAMLLQFRRNVAK